MIIKVFANFICQIFQYRQFPFLNKLFHNFTKRGHMPDRYIIKLAYF